MTVIQCQRYVSITLGQQINWRQIVTNSCSLQENKQSSLTEHVLKSSWCCRSTITWDWTMMRNWSLRQSQDKTYKCWDGAKTTAWKTMPQDALRHGFSCILLPVPKNGALKSYKTNCVLKQLSNGASTTTPLYPLQDFTALYEYCIIIIIIILLTCSYVLSRLLSHVVTLVDIRKGIWSSSQPFCGPFSGTTRVSRCQKRTSGLHDARED